MSVRDSAHIVLGQLEQGDDKEVGMDGWNEVDVRLHVQARARGASIGLSI